MKVFGSYTNMEGDEYSPHPQIMKEFGFEGASCPLIKIVRKKESKEQILYAIKLIKKYNINIIEVDLYG